MLTICMYDVVPYQSPSTIITVQLIFWSNLGQSVGHQQDQSACCYTTPATSTPSCCLSHSLLHLTTSHSQLGVVPSQSFPQQKIWALGPFVWRDRGKLVVSVYKYISVEMMAASPDTVTIQVSSAGLSRFTFLILKCLNRLRYFGWPTEVDLY